MINREELFGTAEYLTL